MAIADKQIKVKYLPGATKIAMPREGDIGIDLFSNEDIQIPDGEARLVKTGAKFQLPKHFALIIKDRSSVSKHLHVMAGVIDNSYTGEIMVRMFCHTNRDCDKIDGTPLGIKAGAHVKKGDKIAQAIITRDFNAEFHMVEEAAEFEDTERGEKGFGSTGK